MTTRIPTLIALFLVFYNCIHCQTSCGYVSELGEDISMEIHHADPVNIKVYWNVVRDDDGNGDNSISLLLSLIDLVTTEYANYGIHLIPACNDKYRIIKNTALTNPDRNYKACEFIAASEEDGLNVFLLDGDKGGYARLPGKTCWASVNSLAHELTIIHEIGHCLGLFHPYFCREWEMNFGGGSGTKWNCSDHGVGGNPEVLGALVEELDCSLNLVGAFINDFEFVDGTNAATSGDYVTDTPASINMYSTRGYCEEYYDCSDLDRCINWTDDDKQRDPKCDTYAPDLNNYMEEGNCGDHFTPNQASRMRGVVVNHLPEIIYHDPLVHRDVNTNEVWGADASYASIRIKSGATLTILGSKIKIGGGLPIYGLGGTIVIEPHAKLELFGTTVTACGDSWKGIECEGSDSQNYGEILMIGATIKKALVGVEMGESLNLGPGVHAGKLTAQFSTFLDNNVGFRHNGGLANDYPYNSISYCNFTNHSQAILSNDNMVLGTSGNSFYNNKYGILLRDAFMDIGLGNTIDGAEVGVNGIEIYGSYPGSAGMVISSGQNLAQIQTQIPNQFSNLQVGITAAGSDGPLDLEVSWSKFTNISQWATELVGANDFSYYNNSLVDCENGLYVEASGIYENEIKCNYFSEINNYGTEISATNSETTFLQNDFSEAGLLKAEFVIQDADIIDEVGSQANPAGNCFSPFGADLGVSADSDHFTYHYEGNPDLPVECKEPGANDYYTKLGSLEKADHCIEDKIGSFRSIDPDGDGARGVVNLDSLAQAPCYSCVLAEISASLALVTSKGYDDPRTSEIEVPSAEQVTPAADAAARQLDDWLNYALYIAVENKNTAFAIEVFGAYPSWNWQKKYYGYYLSIGDVASAATVLDNMELSGENQQNFYEIQKINIKRLQNPSAVSAAELDRLATLAGLRLSSSAYARSLYQILTGNRLPLHHAEVELIDNPLDQRSSAPLGAEPKIYPNPLASDLLHIDFATNDATSEDGTVSVHDIEGNQVAYLETLKQANQLNLSHLQSGLYLLIINADNTEKSRKYFNFMKL